MRWKLNPFYINTRGLAMTTTDIQDEELWNNS